MLSTSVINCPTKSNRTNTQLCPFFFQTEFSSNVTILLKGIRTILAPQLRKILDIFPLNLFIQPLTLQHPCPSSHNLMPTLYPSPPSPETLTPSLKGFLWSSLAPPILVSLLLSVHPSEFNFKNHTQDHLPFCSNIISCFSLSTLIPSLTPLPVLLFFLGVSAFPFTSICLQKSSSSFKPSYANLA